MTFIKYLRFIKMGICCIITLFIILGPGLFESYKDNMELEKEEKETWKGVITIWDYPYYNKELGSKYGWLREKIEKFEKENKGVFIEFKPIDKERGLAEIKAAAKIDELPDIAPVGAEKEILELQLLEKLNSVTENSDNNYVIGVDEVISYEKNIYGKPKLINPNIMIINKDKYLKGEVNNITIEELQDFIASLDKNNKIIYNNAAMLSLQNQVNEGEQLPKEILEKGQICYKTQISKAVEEGNFAMILCDAMALTECFQAIENNSQYKIINFNADEQYIYGECIAYAIFKQGDKNKLEMCKEFLRELTTEEEEKSLYQCNGFAVSNNIISIYDQNSDMGKIESMIKKYNKKFINASK